MSIKYIYTEKTDCQDCYKCIRECPVKAIKMINQSASIITENCIFCGHCTAVCPADAKKVIDDLSKAKYLIQQGYPVYVSLAPSWVSEFQEYSVSIFITLLKKLGFTGVSETAIGAELVSQKIAAMLKKGQQKVTVSPCCPSAVEIIKKYHPEASKYIANVDTPMLAHGKFLREHYGNDIKIVFFGPCIAKKYEADRNAGIIDVVETFDNLKQWITDEGYDVDSISNDMDINFEPYPVKKGNLYPIAGGMIESVESVSDNNELTMMTFSGVKTILPIIKDLDKLESSQPVFLELLACDEGCINGPKTVSEASLLTKRTRILKHEKALAKKSLKPSIKKELANGYDYNNALQFKKFSQQRIEEILKAIGKYSPADELNCGGCGYERCTDFAKAVLEGMAERKMCVSYMRRVANDKASVLLQRMPYGVVIVDKNLCIHESNKAFAELAGDEVVFAYEAKPGLEGADLRKLIPYHDYFQNLINSDESYLEKDVRSGSHLIHLSIFTLEGNNMLCAILHNLHTPELNREQMVERTRKVVRENLETVQKIAFHLGENASRMETLLNSIVDLQDDEYDD